LQRILAVLRLLQVGRRDAAAGPGTAFQLLLLLLLLLLLPSPLLQQALLIRRQQPLLLLLTSGVLPTLPARGFLPWP
jgi:hypothetical protein